MYILYGFDQLFLHFPTFNKLNSARPLIALAAKLAWEFVERPLTLCNLLANLLPSLLRRPTDLQFLPLWWVELYRFASVSISLVIITTCFWGTPKQRQWSKYHRVDVNVFISHSKRKWSNCSARFSRTSRLFFIPLPVSRNFFQTAGICWSDIQ